ncbi:MAG TPA: response regulator [Flavisolibacter sp.]|nr:response regulator [Flavisolibacter sp.]
MSKSILSVNGNKAMNYLLQTIFEKEYDFVPVIDVYQALYKLRSNRSIKALVVDVDFQSQQSWELIEHIKSSKLYRIPIVVLTTANSEAIRQRCYEYEIDEIFFKPFNPVDLITAVKSIIELDVTSNV